MNIEDFIVGELDADNHLDLFDESRMAFALDEYVSKEQAQAINDSVSKMREKQQSTLIKQRHGHLEEAEDVVAVTTKSRKKLARECNVQVDINTTDDIHANAQTSPTRRSRGAHENVESTQTSIDSDFISSANRSSKAQGRNRHVPMEDERDYLEEQAVAVAQAPPLRRRRVSTKKTTYAEDDSDPSVVEIMENPVVRKTTTIGVRAGKAYSHPSSRETHSLSQRSFVPAIPNARAKRKRAILTFGSGSDEDVNNDSDEDWETAKTDTLE
jgi:hypothetical protein